MTCHVISYACHTNSGYTKWLIDILLCWHDKFAIVSTLKQQFSFEVCTPTGCHLLVCSVYAVIVQRKYLGDECFKIHALIITYLSLVMYGDLCYDVTMHHYSKTVTKLSLRNCRNRWSDWEQRTWDQSITFARHQHPPESSALRKIPQIVEVKC